jgi:hypothetical protein
LPEGNEKVVANAIVNMDVATLKGQSAAAGKTGLGGLFSRAKPITPNADLSTMALALQLAQARGATQVKQLFVAGQFAAFVAFS